MQRCLSCGFCMWCCHFGIQLAIAFESIRQRDISLFSLPFSPAPPTAFLPFFFFQRSAKHLLKKHRANVSVGLWSMISISNRITMFFSAINHLRCKWSSPTSSDLVCVDLYQRPISDRHSPRSTAPLRRERKNDQINQDNYGTPGNN